MHDFRQYLTRKPHVKGFFDPETHTVQYVVADTATHTCAIIDSVMDYEPDGATISFSNAKNLIDYVEASGLTVEWILETHVHADHLSAAPYLQQKLGGKLAIGEHIRDIQELFGKVFNAGTEFQRDGSQFDRLFAEGDVFSIGSIPATVLYTPGHTPADVSYIIGDAVFVGDTLFMPDYGTARADFPGGSPEDMFASAQKLYQLPEEMRMFMCHDYLPQGRSTYKWETSVGEQKRTNIQLNAVTTLDDFSTSRKARDEKLGMPRLIIPSIQVNMRAGELPPNESSGAVFLKVPVNNIFSKKPRA